MGRGILRRTATGSVGGGGGIGAQRRSSLSVQHRLQAMGGFLPPTTVVVKSQLPPRIDTLLPNSTYGCIFKVVSPGQFPTLGNSAGIPLPKLCPTKIIHIYVHNADATRTLEKRKVKKSQKRARKRKIKQVACKSGAPPGNTLSAGEDFEKPSPPGKVYTI